MSLPPQLIHVKRKRTEEAPMPSFLRIEHNTKRHRSNAFLYRRHDPAELAARARKAAAEAHAATMAGRPPVIQASSPRGAKKLANDSPASPKKTADMATTTATTTATITPSAPFTPTPTTPAVPAEPRRFHLSRESLLGPRAAANTPQALGVSALAGIRKNTRYGSNPSPAIFVERSKRRHRIGTSRRDGSGSQLTPAVTVEAVPANGSSTPLSITASFPRLPKRPSWRGPLRSASPASFRSVSPAPAPAPTSANTNVSKEEATAAGSGLGDAASALPPSVLHRQWDTDMNRLAEEMNKYTLDIIGRNLSRMEQDSRAAEARDKVKNTQSTMDDDDMMAEIAAERRRAAYAKYKPRVAPRYAERHHEDSTAAALDAEAPRGRAGAGAISCSSESEGESDNEEDYVTETYVRVPGHEVPQAAHVGGAAEGTVGLLVFDNEPDMEVFYGAEEESDDEFDDDEDENAENYYTHDYPEDEVASDDEFDRDAYHYLTGNASDLEEFEESDNEEASLGEKK